MSPERRYNEEEVAAILERATTSRSSQANLPSNAATGFTLAELQEIGAEAGIAPEEIAAAARAVSTQASAPPVRTLLGAPRSVARIVPLTRELADAEWTRIVVALRETFGAEGRIREYGSLRTWRNGNLQVHAEPDGDGYRLRTLPFRAGPRRAARRWMRSPSGSRHSSRTERGRHGQVRRRIFSSSPSIRSSIPSASTFARPATCTGMNCFHPWS